MARLPDDNLNGFIVFNALFLRAKQVNFIKINVTKQDWRLH
jgi:hypothetical protein